ncbi:MAG: Hpt domain-containing protein [Candidatus Korobacteraceae bacterium]
MSTHWDRAAALHRLDGDEPLLEELIGVFFQDYPTVSERLSQALLCGDLDSACETAHSLKGSLVYIGFSDAADLALEIEKASRAKDSAGAQQAAAALRTEIATVQQVLASTGEPTYGSVAE